MKIVSLNIWGGRVGEDFVNFISRNASDIDIFCFQEVYKDAIEPLRGTIYQKPAEFQSFYLLEKLLPDHQLFFHPAFLESYGICLCIRKSIEVLETGEVFIHKDRHFVPEGDYGHHGRNLQYAVIKSSKDAEPITIINVHGLWNGQGKTDTEDRIQQSQRIIDFIKNVKTEIILCGDFNLKLDTKSILMIEELGLKNLIREYNISSTRTSLYEKQEKHADYVFLSEGIKEKHFSVLPDEVSDHSPLLLEI